MSDGVSIGGNSYGPVAAGRGAQASQRDVTISTGGGEDRLAVALAELRRLVGEHRDAIPEAGRVERDIETLGQDLREDSPDKPRLLDTIKRITGRVVLAAPVVSAVNDVRELVEALPG